LNRHRPNPNPKMNPQDPNTTLISDINHRLIVPIQTRGGLGKSTVAITLCEWMHQRKIQWRGYDLDGFNRTLSTVFPDEVTAVEMSREPEADIIKILRKVAQQDVTLIDPSAHMNKTILSSFEKIDFTSFAARAQVRTTVMIYPMDEVSDMDDISETVDVLGDRVDWIVVRNPVRIATTRFFDGSELETTLKAYKAVNLEIPPLLSDTRNHLRAHEVQLGRGLSPAEALKNLSLKIDLVHRTILERWLADLFRCFDAIALHLVPTVAAREIQPATKAVPRRSLRKEAAINLENIL
jgi:hypothetical protein